MCGKKSKKNFIAIMYIKISFKKIQLGYEIPYIVLPRAHPLLPFPPSTLYLYKYLLLYCRYCNQYCFTNPFSSFFFFIQSHYNLWFMENILTTSNNQTPTTRNKNHLKQIPTTIDTQHIPHLCIMFKL